jgi:hypothetical protein
MRPIVRAPENETKDEESDCPGLRLPAHRTCALAQDLLPPEQEAPHPPGLFSEQFSLTRLNLRSIVDLT